MRRVFISYVSPDVSHRDALVTHLEVLCRAGIIESWHDGLAQAGEDWKQAANQNLHRSDIIVFLVSSDFLASVHHFDAEFTASLARGRAMEVHIVPIIVRDCAWELSPLSDHKVLPSTGVPIERWLHRDEPWTEVIRFIGSIATRPVHLASRSIIPLSQTTNRTPDESQKTDAAPTCMAKAIREPPSAAMLPPRPQRFFGRDTLSKQLEGAILRDPAPSIILLGPAGIGKSTLTLEALHRPSVAARFGARRWFVRLDAAPTAETAIGLVAAALGLTPRGDPIADVRSFLARTAGVLALDNLETPWDTHTQREPIEEVLCELAAIPGLVLIASVRGILRPLSVAWKERIELRPLQQEPAADLFCDIAGARRDDPALAKVLAPLDGVPLALTLLAYVAEGASLTGLARDWDRKHTALLAKEGTKAGRETNWAASMAVSLESPPHDARGAVASRAPGQVAGRRGARRH